MSIVMLTELRLFFTDEKGDEQQAIINTSSFTIGRNTNNDLVLTDPGLSRRHALITRVDKAAQITDCDSQNGTFVNGQLITRAVGLKDGDIIALGQSCELRVRVVNQVGNLPKQAALSYVPQLAARGNANETIQSLAPPPSSAPGNDFSGLSPIAIATVAILVILLLAGGLMAYQYFQRKPTIEPHETPSNIAATPSPTGTEPPLTPPRISTPEVEIEKLAIQVIQKISLEQTYAFRPNVLDELKQRTGKYANSTLAKALRAIQEHRQKIAQQAKDANINPYLLGYLALAETNGGQDGNPLEIVRRALPRLQRLWVDYGGDLGDSSLLIIAAYQAPLRTTAGKNAQTDRNVWYLHKQSALSPEAYDFVLRFLAYGIIAQNPGRFSLDADALVF